MQRRGGEDVAKLGPAALKARRADVGDVVRGGRDVGLGTVKTGKGGIERHGLFLSFLRGGAGASAGDLGWNKPDQRKALTLSASTSP